MAIGLQARVRPGAGGPLVVRGIVVSPSLSGGVAIDDPASPGAADPTVMVEIASSGDPVREGDAALARAACREARYSFQRALDERETVEALEGLACAAWWVEDLPSCLEPVSAPTG